MWKQRELEPEAGWGELKTLKDWVSYILSCPTLIPQPHLLEVSLSSKKCHELGIKWSRDELLGAISHETWHVYH